MWAVLVGAVFGVYLLLRWRRSGRPLAEAFGLDLTRLYARLWHRWSARGRWALPAKGAAVIVANHTCSADAAFLVAGAPRLLGFLTSREHYEAHPLIHWLLSYLGCVPVTRNGRDAVAARAALRQLARGQALCVFPEGNLSGVARGRLVAPKHGAAFLALCSGAPIYPAYIAGGPRTRHLLQAWLWPQGKAVRVYFGPPVDLSAYRDQPRTRRLLEEVTRKVMERILALRPEVSAHHGVKSCPGWVSRETMKQSNQA
jgi:1-acyl-sn-glycerol-3-phosphate acyltransferase